MMPGKKRMKQNAGGSGILTAGQGMANQPSPRQLREYEGFGPWAMVVEGPEDMPLRFDPWYADLAQSELILKLPRQVERRDLRPGDLLYTSVLALGSGKISYLCLSRQGEVERRDLGLDQLSALRLEKELLRGSLGLDLSDGSLLAIGFNTVSMDLFEDFVQRLLSQLEHEAKAPFVPPRETVEPGEENNLFRFMLADLRRRHSGLALLAYQGPTKLEAPKGGRPRGFLSQFTPWRLDASLLAQYPGGLVAIRESAAPRKRKAKGYRVELIYLVAGHFREAGSSAKSLPNGACYQSLGLAVDGHSYDLPFAADPGLEPCP
jgi:hypothetical protein